MTSDDEPCEVVDDTAVVVSSVFDAFFDGFVVTESFVVELDVRDHHRICMDAALLWHVYDVISIIWAYLLTYRVLEVEEV